MTRATEAYIDLSALKHNLSTVRALAPHKKIMAVIKADGYGHGLLTVARALFGADTFAVACLDEAVALREGGVRDRIVLLEGFYDEAELRAIVEYGLIVVVHHEAQVGILLNRPLKGLVPLWVKVDTGMHRLGLPPNQIRDIYNRLQGCPWIQWIGMMTHFASADLIGDNGMRAQMLCFQNAVAGLPGQRSLANSAALIACPQSHGDWVRPGIVLYGASPFAGRCGADHGLKPVMGLYSRLIAVNPCRKGDHIGYGGDWVCPEDMKVGVAAIGYGDGYPRCVPSGTPVLVNGQRLPLIGRVSMDMLCIDLRNQPEAKIGDTVCLWGAGLPVEEIARAADTIPYELLCRITKRVHFRVAS